ncbi:histidine kinase [Allonocardiopsis opalescens]|uniref:HicB-like protein involved in pilus formation n=1 Tax=Allonocardiopsis opalescens TaxID=1144618 RepID=A0A2T0Q2F1_9ACTN|nr:histidine kinase [Allonocardiopsis opalescens]PRX97972.1 hypothetical protein CLV72_105325 [Allonocardiopsis opalescens]
MDLTPYVDKLHRQLVAAAEAGSEETRATAEHLAASLDSAARLAVMDALSDAADEITRDFAPGSVEVRLRGRHTDFIVTPPPVFGSFDETGDDGPAGTPGRPGDIAPEYQPEADDGGTARVTLRLPDHLKPRVEDAARREGLSVNAWLVRAVTATLDTGARRADRGTGRQIGRGHTGWVR